MRYIYLRLARFIRAFVILGVPAVMGEPPERPLDHPPLPDRDEPNGPSGSVHDLDLIPLGRGYVVV